MCNNATQWVNKLGEQVNLSRQQCSDTVVGIGSRGRRRMSQSRSQPFGAVEGMA